MRRARLRPLAGVGAAGLAVLLVAACGSAASSSAPTWEPSPGFGTNGEGPGVRLTPIIPEPSLSPSAAGQPPAGGGSSGATPSPSSSSKVDPLVVATHLRAPVGLTMMPDNTALVGERTTGRIVRVQPQAGQPVPTVRVLHGLDTSGDGGLLDLALSPSYDEDSLIYAYITTPTDNRVVDFTLHGPVTPVLTGIPKGRTGNTGRLAFDSAGQLYVGTGDAGHPSLAADPKSLAGKVLRVNGIGRPATGNPSRTSPVWTSGHHLVDGLCTLPQSTTVLEVDGGAAHVPDEINQLARGAGYGWPKATATSTAPLTKLSAADGAPGGCAVINTTLYVTTRTGQAVLSAHLGAGATGAAVGTFSPQLAHRYGRLLTVVAADDGALWLTTTNRDGHGHPVAADERVIRYVPTASGGGNNPA